MSHLVEVDRIELSSVVIPLQAFYYVKTISPPYTQTFPSVTVIHPMGVRHLSILLYLHITHVIYSLGLLAIHLCIKVTRCHVLAYFNLIKLLV